MPEWVEPDWEIFEPVEFEDEEESFNPVSGITLILLVGLLLGLGIAAWYLLI